MSENISDLCYKFIDANPNYFNLTNGAFSKNHEIAIEELEKYANQQTCSKPYFQLMTDIYKKSHYIGPEEFIQYYTSSVNKLHSIGDEKNIILLLPGYKFNPGEPVDFTKSNYYFTLYFMKLYRDVTGENIKNVYPMIIKGGKHVYINELDIDVIINELRETTKKESTLVICDDFSYSGEQLSYIIGNVIPVRQEVDLYLVICGMTNTAKRKLGNIKSKYEYDNPKLNINIIFPDEGGYFLDENDFSSVLKNIMIENNVLMMSQDEYIKQHDMFLISKHGDALYVYRQFNNLYGRITNSLTYPFFKYPDHVSTLTKMCVVNNYSKDYVFLYKNLDPEMKRKIDSQGNSNFTINGYLDIETQRLKDSFGNGKFTIDDLNTNPRLNFLKANFDFLKANFDNKEEMAKYLTEHPDFNLIEICDANLKLINLANCDEPKPDAISINCNTNCWKPFYKIIIEEGPFIEFNSIIDSLVSKPTRLGGKKSKKSKSKKSKKSKKIKKSKKSKKRKSKKCNKYLL